MRYIKMLHIIKGIIPISLSNYIIILLKMKESFINIDKIVTERIYSNFGIHIVMYSKRKILNWVLIKKYNKKLKGLNRTI
jgi:hypothetical protein